MFSYIQGSPIKTDLGSDDSEKHYTSIDSVDISIKKEKTEMEPTIESKPTTPQLVDGPTLLTILFPEKCRPTHRWLQKMQKARVVPYVKIGRLVFYDPDSVRDSIIKRNTVHLKP